MSIADTGSLDSSVKLRVAGNLQLGSDNSGGAITKIYESSGLNLDSGSSSRPIYFRINGTEKLKIETSGNATFAGDVTVSGGDIILGGTGRIQGVDTVSASTDAANKAYVDLEIATRTPLNDIRSLGVEAFTNGTNPNITTAQVMDEIDSDGGFDSYSSVFKTLGVMQVITI